jgi:hypothetical protein
MSNVESVKPMSHQMVAALDKAMASEETPTAVVLDQLERRLATNRCIGSLLRWELRYSYGIDFTRGGLDRNQINFSLHEAGRFEFRAGRRSMTPRQFSELVDDRAYRFAGGTYDVAKDRLEMEFCGPNLRCG